MTSPSPAISIPPRNKAVAVALWANFGVLVIIALALVSRGNDRFPSFLPLANAQNPAPIAGGGGVFIMPAQFSTNTWGAYLLDIDAQTLVAYQYNNGQHQLQLMAARSYKYDRRLTNFNTSMAPAEVEQLIAREERLKANEQPQSNPAIPTTQQP